MAVGILSADDLQAVTGYVKPSAQARALIRMGIALHRSVSMIAAYRRKPEKVEPPR